MSLNFMKDFRYIVILLAVTLFLSFFGLGNMALTDPDETFYAETAREMISAGEWSIPLIFGEPQFEKPIFYYWLVMLSYILFGITEFAARFPSAVFGLIGVIGTYFLGRLAYSRLAGLFSGLIMATCVQYIVLSRACVTDMVLTVFILLCFLFLLEGWETGKRRWYLLSSMCAALAVLTKGPIGLFIPACVTGIYIILTRQWNKVKAIPIIPCLLIFFAVSLPWYIIASKIHGSTFINEFFGFQNITRFLEPEHKIGSSPFFYLPVIIGGFFPWTFFLPSGVWDMWKGGARSSRIRSFGIFLAVWFLTVFLFFSISRTKLVTYIFPLFPVMAIVVGRLWEKYVTGTDSAKINKHIRVSFNIFLIFSIFAMIGIYIFVNLEFVSALAGTAIAVSIFGVGLLASFLMMLRGRKIVSFLMLILAILFLSIPLVKYILPVIEEHESSKPLCVMINELSGPNDPIGGESDHCRGVAFYTKRTDIKNIQNYSVQVGFFSQKGRVWGIIKKKHYRDLIKSNPDIVSDPLMDYGKKVLVTNK